MIKEHAILTASALSLQIASATLFDVD